MLSVPVGDRESGKKLSLRSWYVEGYEDRRGGPDDTRPGPCAQEALASAKLTDSACLMPQRAAEGCRQIGPSVSGETAQGRGWPWEKQGFKAKDKAVLRWRRKYSSCGFPDCKQKAAARIEGIATNFQGKDVLKCTGLTTLWHLGMCDFNKNFELQQQQDLFLCLISELNTP